MILRQTLVKPVNGYWDGGAKQVFDWNIRGLEGHDSKGTYTRIGSFEANYWFNVAKGRTDRQTLSYAKKRLQASTSVPSTFEYI